MVTHRRTFVVLFAAASLTAIAAPALAAPPIAYSKQAGSGFDIYLANPDGSGAVKLHSTPARNSAGFDMRPAPNEMALVESRSTGFKIVRYSDAGVKTSVTPFNDGCYVDSLDYHPSDGSLLVIRRCLNPQTVEVRIWADGAYQPAMLSTNGMNDAYRGARWLGDGSGFLMVYSTPAGAVLRRHSLDNPSAPVEIKSWDGLGAGPRAFDTARCPGGVLAPACMKILYEDSTGVRELTYSDSGPGSDTLLFSGASGGHYSHDNSRILYRAPAPKGTYTLNVTNPPQTVGAKAGYGGSDWRP